MLRTSSPIELLKLLSELSGTRGQMLSPNTHLSYGYDWKRFSAWCQSAGKRPLPAAPETVMLFLAEMLCHGKKVNTAQRHAAGIAFHHLMAKVDSPVTAVVQELLSGAKRLLVHEPRQMEPITVDHVRAICKTLLPQTSRLAIRNRALLVVGFSSGLRSATLCAVDIRDVRTTEQGIVLFVRKEKQEHSGKPRKIGLPIGAHEETCPLRSLQAWIAERGNRSGPLFVRCDWAARGKLLPLHPNCVAEVVKASLARAGFDNAGFASHSLRAGFITAAGEAGAGELLIADQTGHRSMQVLRGYFRRRDVFRANAASMLGL